MIFEYSVLITDQTNQPIPREKNHRRPPEEPLGLLAQMRSEGLSPNSYTFVGVLTGLAGEGSYELSRKLLEEAKMSLDLAGQGAVYSVAINNCGVGARCEEAAPPPCRLGRRGLGRVGSDRAGAVRCCVVVCGVVRCRR